MSLEDLIDDAESGDDDALEALDKAARINPRSVTPYLRRLVDAEQYWLPTVYLGADDALQARLVEIIEADTLKADGPLSALVQTRGPVADQALLGWVDAPGGLSNLDVSWHILQGGRIVEDGAFRELCGPRAVHLVRAADSLPPAEDASNGAARCPWCTSPLWTVFDLDASDDRVTGALAHAGWQGRLRLTTCAYCSCYGTVFHRVEPDGTTAILAQHRPTYLDISGKRGELVPEQPYYATLTVGQDFDAPHEPVAWNKGGSSLGGSPDWIQEARYDTCPSCDRIMDFAAMIVGVDLVDKYGDGAYYVSLCAPCRVAAISYQQT